MACGIIVIVLSNATGSGLGRTAHVTATKFAGLRSEQVSALPFRSMVSSCHIFSHESRHVSSYSMQFSGILQFISVFNRRCLGVTLNCIAEKLLLSNPVFLFQIGKRVNMRFVSCKMFYITSYSWPWLKLDRHPCRRWVWNLIRILINNGAPPEKAGSHKLSPTSILNSGGIVGCLVGAREDEEGVPANWPGTEPYLFACSTWSLGGL